MNPTVGQGAAADVYPKSLRRITLIALSLALISLTPQSPGQPGGVANPKGTQSGSAYTLIPVSARQAAPDLSITDIAGNKITLSQYRGKVVLLDFWAVDCGGCVIEIPWYVQFDKKYRDQGLQLIGLDMYDEAPSYIKPFMQKSQMNYPVAVGNDDIRKRFQAEELPKTILIDRKGRVAVSHVGIVDRDAFARDNENLIREP